MSGPAEQLVQRILASFADESDAVAARLLAEARAEAEADVKALLKSAMKAALLQRAAAQLGGVEAVEPSQTRPESIPDLACYVYAITRDEPDASRLPPGVDPRHAPRVLPHRGLCAIVSDVPLDEFGQAALDRRVADINWIGEKVRAHDAVIKTVGVGGAVIPLRFCTVVREEDDVRRVIDAHHDRVAEILDNLNGKAEWGVKIRWSQPARADEPDSGRSYLMRQKHRAAGGVPRPARDVAEKCHQRLAGLAADAATLPLKHQAEANGAAAGQVVLNGAYLVADGDARAFHELVESQNAAHVADGISLEITGPWPAYNFVNLDLSLERAA